MHDQGTRERRLFLSLLLIIAPFGAHAWTAATAATRSRGPLMFHRSTQRLSRAMSLTSLQEVAQRLVNNTTGSGVTSSSPLVCIVVAGGGGSSISTLASTEGASNVFLEGTVTYDQNAFHSYTNLPKSSSNDDDDEQEKFRYVSSEAAHLLSQAALKRALRYRPQLTDQVRCVGIGCTSSLISTASRPRPGRISRGHIVATRADGRQWECKLKLASTAKNKRRSRVEEDLIVSELILSGIEQIMMVSEQSTDHSSLGDDEDIVEQRLKEQHVPSTDIVQESAASIIEKGSVESVLLVPQKPDRDGRRFIAVQNPTIPQGCLIFPGSFNPPHVGHVTLANVAASRVDVPASTPVLLELSVTNPDKPSIDPKVVSERVHKFFDLDNMPQNWGVLLTSAPLFSQKVDIYSDQIVTVNKNLPKMFFVIGTDTMLRILDPKYYGDSEASMLDAVYQMKSKGVHFVVGGRLENGKKETNKFITGEEELRRLPEYIQDMFTLVSEDEFRLDISSTEIRSNQQSRR